MSIQTMCPECRSRFTLAEQQVGKKIRCGKCQAVFQAQPSKAARRQDEDEDEDAGDSPRSRIRTEKEEDAGGSSRSRTRPNVTTTPASRKAAAGPPREDEDDRPSRRRNEKEDDRAVSKKEKPAAAGKSLVPWLVGGAVACISMLTVGGIVIAMMLRPTTPDKGTQAINNTQPPPIQGNNLNVPPPPLVSPPQDTPAPQVTPKDTPAVKPTPPDDDPTPVRTAKGEITPELTNAVMRSTVFIKVTTPDGGGGSGTGFFGDPDAPNIILTNAHVVGMLSPDSPKPKEIKVILNSGQSDEKTFMARVLGVDRDSDLAVLDIGVTDGMPKALKVKSATKLHRLQKIYVFGFPYGEQLGKEITVRESKVASLRNKNGVLDRIQADGGMDPGNSGGPVVDEFGHVVGVSVAVWSESRQIAFAVPGDRVKSILNGRIAGLDMDLAYKEGGKLGTPVTVEMLDPRSRIKEMAFEVWTGDAPPAAAPTRTGSNVPPEPLPGDSSRQRFKFTYAGGRGQGELVWPTLPVNKVFWYQPVWIHNDGKTHWAPASVYKVTPLTTIERKSIFLTARWGGNKRVKVSVLNRFLIGADNADAEVGRITTEMGFTETALSDRGETSLRLSYNNVDRKTAWSGLPPQKDADLAFVKANVGVMTANIRLDKDGNVTTSGLLPTNALLRVPEAKRLIAFHNDHGSWLNTGILPLPNKTVASKATWMAHRMVSVSMPLGPVPVRLELTCTYLGVRTTAGREEAVVSLAGPVRHAKVGGKVKGLMIVDTGSGTVRSVDLNIETEMELVFLIAQAGKMQKLKVRSLTKLGLNRAL